MLKEAKKSAAKKLSKIKNVEIFLGKKKVKATFHRLNKNEFLTKVHIKHKSRKVFIFNKVKMNDKRTGKTINKRKLDRIYTLEKGDVFSLTWTVSAKLIER